MNKKFYFVDKKNEWIGILHILEGDLIKNTLDSEYSEQKMLICTSEFVWCEVRSIWLSLNISCSLAHVPFWSRDSS